MDEQMTWLAVSAFITIATVSVFAYRSRAQQLRHRAEEEAARHFAEFQVRIPVCCSWPLQLHTCRPLEYLSIWSTGMCLTDMQVVGLQ